MKKALKVIGKIFLIILILLIVFLLAVFIFHEVMLKKEAPLLEKPLGQLVDIDGQNMCVYTEGSGDKTLVFLSGSGTAAPILDFRMLGTKLKDDCRIVVIEKFGYGFSDISDDERSFDTILRQDREALEKLGIKAPFVLCPHSMSGLEAVLWAQEYPDEVEAIIGLDAAFTGVYENFDIEASLRKEKLAAFARELGIIRFFYTDNSLPEGLTAEEKKIYKAIAAKKAVNKNVVSEAEHIREACEIIDRKPKPDVPALLFCSNGSGTGLEKESWLESQKDYASGLTNARLIELDCPHYVHNFETDRIYSEIKSFLSQL